jgi:catechol 2,3-dioxygenase-like lactoylglutathione lyase family enzyme
MSVPVAVEGVLEACLYGGDLGAAERFYGGIIGLPVYARVPGRHVFFRCGEGMFLMFDPAATRKGIAVEGGETRLQHGPRGPGHVAFRVAESEITEWRAKLAAAGVRIEAEVAWPGGGRSIYVRDPSGNSVELATASVWGLASESTSRR